MYSIGNVLNFAYYHGYLLCKEGVIAASPQFDCALRSVLLFKFLRRFVSESKSLGLPKTEAVCLLGGLQRVAREQIMTVLYLFPYNDLETRSRCNCKQTSQDQSLCIYFESICAF